MKERTTRALFFTAALAVSLVLLAAATATDWRNASRESAHIAPEPAAQPEAVVQVYAARAINWRGWFAVHTWIAVKEKKSLSYTTFQVTGWAVRRGRDARGIKADIPDRLWFGAEPQMVESLVGPKAEAAIPKIRAAVEGYPYPHKYHVWPGPNSNTFTSYVLRRVPELKVELPPTAIGRDWLAGAKPFGRTESGTGVEASLFGLLGVTLGVKEGVEVNVFGLVFGADLLRPALKLPVIGRVGVRDE